MNLKRLIDIIIISLVKYIFYLKAIVWILTRKKKIDDMREILIYFYYDFLNIDKKDIEIKKLTNNELVTEARNPCPILSIALRLNIDTKIICKKASEPVCKFFLRQLNPRLVFLRDYNEIRPYADFCKERIIKE